MANRADNPLGGTRPKGGYAKPVCRFCEKSPQKWGLICNDPTWCICLNCMLTRCVKLRGEELPNELELAAVVGLHLPRGKNMTLDPKLLKEEA